MDKSPDRVTELPIVSLNRVIELPIFSLNRVTTDSERTYDTPSGISRSVTTVLEATRDKTGLLEWRERIGEKEADRIRDMAAFRGTKTHEAIEHLLLTGEDPPYDFVVVPYWKSIEPFVRSIDAPLIMEAPVWHPDGYAGTLDCLAYLHPEDTQPALLDWKTADKPCNPIKLYEYSLQCAAYRHAVNHVYGPYGVRVDTAAIVVAIADQDAQIHWLDEDALDQLYQHFLARLQRFTRSR